MSDEASRLLTLLRPGADKTSMAGSLRRGERYVSDIEFVAAPRWEEAEDGKRDLLLQAVERMEQDGTWSAEPVPPYTHRAQGQRYRRYYLPFRGRVLPVDLFIVRPPASWGVILLLRTGPDTFSKAMVTQRRKGGLLPDGLFVKNGTLWRGRSPEEPERIEVSTEEQWFDLIGIPWVHPGVRVPIDKSKGERYCRKCGGPWRPGLGCWCLESWKRASS